MVRSALFAIALLFVGCATVQPPTRLDCWCKVYEDTGEQMTRCNVQDASGRIKAKSFPNDQSACVR